MYEFLRQNHNKSLLGFLTPSNSGWLPAKHFWWQVLIAVEETSLHEVPAGYGPGSETLLGLDAGLKGCSN